MLSGRTPLVLILFVFALSCCLRLFLTLYAGLFIMLSFAELCEYTGSCTLTLKTAKSTVKSFAFLNSNFCHYSFSLPSRSTDTQNLHVYKHLQDIIHNYEHFVNRFLLKNEYIIKDKFHTPHKFQEMPQFSAICCIWQVSRFCKVRRFL